MATMTIIVAYDIVDDSRRVKVATTLQTYGERIQYSLFLLAVGRDTYIDVKSRIESLIDSREDSVYFLTQCAKCWGHHDGLGQAQPQTPETSWQAL